MTRYVIGVAMASKVNPAVQKHLLLTRPHGISPGLLNLVHAA
jgi:hypothetical protein